MSKFLNNEFNQEVAKVLCPVLSVLATGCPLSSLINYRFIDTLSEIVRNILTSSSTNTLRTELPEICSLLDVAKTHHQLDSIIEFMYYLLSTIKTVHMYDINYDEGSEILESYNPEKQGTAYYFTKHGGRLREMPQYVVTKEKTSDDTDKTCHKAFYNATKGGTTFLFLWFDPLHGHCYGFHVITSSEGRKDPFSSAYLFMETPPTEIFYDFSCQLEEYCLNREPKFWRCCRFYHDIFHGFSHKCPYVYMSKRIPALDIGINSEICEQFNAYIQKIKYSAQSMNQSHFIFYLQYFIHRWNKAKKKKMDDEMKLALLLMA